MKKIESNIFVFLLVSLVIHSVLIFFISRSKNQASIKEEQPRVVMLELASLSTPEKTIEKAPVQPLNEPVEDVANQKLEAPKQKPITTENKRQPPTSEPIKPDRAQAPTPIPAPAPAPAPAPKLKPQQSQPRQSSKTSPKKQTAPKSAEVVGSQSNQNKPQNQSIPSKSPSASGTKSQQSKTKSRASTSQVKPRRVVQCLSCPKPRYPKRALRKGIEGEPRILITINSEGRVQKVQLERSSGNPEIDRAALNAGRRSRFQAIAGGARVPVSYSVVIRGSEKHQQAVQRKEKEGYTLPTDTDNLKQPATTNAN